MDMHQFFLGNSFDAHDYFGAHPQDNGFVFRTLAPNAKAVSLIWEGNGWREITMKRVHDGGVYEIFVPSACPGQMYKYRIYPTDPAADIIDHCDPYGFGMELRPQNASILRRLDGYRFHDESWMKTRGDHYHKPVNIYEVHLGSWRKNPADPHGWYRYDELAPKLCAYVKDHGYNYIECMPLSEHPADESWGYQNTGFFAPTSRYGTAQQLQRFVDICHNAGVGVILDFVPVHFAVDGYALQNYDGTPLYEYPRNDVTYSEWGSCNFIHSRGEVCSFLESNAHFWLSVFHFDGLRMDAVSRLLYWGGDESRGANPSGIAFLKRMNAGLKSRHPDVILIAEDSSSFDGVTKPVAQGGLGFDYKWDMGWMHDTLAFFQQYPWERSHDYHKLTFSMLYFYRERYLLPLSHDENVHGKATVMQKMFGEYDQKFPQARCLYLYMFAHPGKKLLFMGSELGQLREWTEKQEQDFTLLSYPIHDAFARFMTDLCRIYQAHPALYASDFEPEGFSWLECHEESRCIFAIERRGGGERAVIVLHLTDAKTEEYALRVPGAQSLTPLLHTDWNIYGGDTPTDAHAIPPGADGAFPLTLPPFSGMLFRVQ